MPSSGVCPTGTFLSTDGDTEGDTGCVIARTDLEDEGARKFVATLVQRTACKERAQHGARRDRLSDASEIRKALYATCYFHDAPRCLTVRRIAEYAKSIEKHWASVDDCLMETGACVEEPTLR
ncbi:MAG: hypothetical protein U0165_19420 [Polyangiaceae bacterium]